MSATHLKEDLENEIKFKDKEILELKKYIEEIRLVNDAQMKESHVIFEKT